MHTPSPAARSALLITGTVGASKTTTAFAVGDVLRAAAVPHAIIDLDAMRAAWPSPDDDPFNVRLELTNLRDVARNHLAAGAVRLVLAVVLEDPAARILYADAIGITLTVCRLRMDLSTVAARLRRRHHDDRGVLDWHLRRSEELEMILDNASIGDAVVTVASNSAPIDVAGRVVEAANWNLTTE